MANRFLTCWLMGACLGVATCPSAAQTAKVYVSSAAGDRLTAKPDVQFRDGKPGPGATFEINAAVKFQKMDGFGASLMEAGIITLIHHAPLATCTAPSAMVTAACVGSITGIASASSSGCR